MKKYTDTLLHIDGEWVEASDKRMIPVRNPASDEIIGRVAHATITDLDRAALSAQRGFETWRNFPAHEREGIMRRAAAILRERADGIAHLMTLEQGKPLAESRLELAAAADVTEWFADEGLRIYGRIVPSRNINAQQMIMKEPVGPVAAFTPWNFPVNQIIRKLAACLAAGCSMIVKAPEETPASPAALIQAFIDAGVPKGVIGLVFGNPGEISSYLISHPAIRKVTFTGSTSVGKEIASLAGKFMKRSTMELGGHAPVIVCEDADVLLAAKASAYAKFRNAGQTCIAPTRYLVHESVLNEFTKAFIDRARDLTVGDGLDPETTMGPLANSRRLIAMDQFTTNAIATGATLELGGKRIGESGNFFAPTVLSGVPNHAEIFNIEPFGPIASISCFDSIEDAIAESNRLPYGLASYAFTSSLKTAHLLSRKLEVGMLWINQPAAPFVELHVGGVKDSGYGSEGGPEALEAYLTTKTVSIMNV